MPLKGKFATLEAKRPIINYKFDELFSDRNGLFLFLTHGQSMFIQVWE